MGDNLEDDLGDHVARKTRREEANLMDGWCEDVAWNHLAEIMIRRWLL